MPEKIWKKKSETLQKIPKKNRLETWIFKFNYQAKMQTFRMNNH